MKIIYNAKDIMEAHIVAGLLETNGIQSHVSGHYLQSAVGEMAAFDFAKVIIYDEDFEKAKVLIAEYENKQPLELTKADNQTKEISSNSHLGPQTIFKIILFCLILFFLSAILIT